jgi:hypothetical protein
MAFAGSMRMLIMACVDALPNCAAIWTRVFAFASASLLAMLMDIAPFVDEMLTGEIPRFPFDRTARSSPVCSSAPASSNSRPLDRCDQDRHVADNWMTESATVSEPDRI